MAIGSYYDVYNVEEYKKRVSDIANGISELKTGSFYFEAKNQVKQQIENLKSKEEKIFSILKVKNIEELNSRLEEYKKAVLNLSGPALNQAFIGIIRRKNESEFEAFREAVLSVIQEDLLKNKSIEEIGIEEAQRRVLDFLNRGLSRSGNIKYRSTSGMTKEGFFPASFTSAQQKRWESLLLEKYSDRPKIKKYIDVKVTSDRNSMRAEFSWDEITEQLTQEEARDRLYSDEINEINRKIKDLILSKVGEDKFLVSQIIDYVLSENRLVFFVGENYNDIIGLLGEIQGLYYISKFLGDDFATALSWRGGVIGADGRKPHQDILLEKFGIQVKNTTRDALIGMGDIGFSSANIKVILNRIGISQEATNVFLNYYGTLGFNVEYHRDRRRRKGTQYLPGLRRTDKNASTFANERKRLLSFQKDIDTLLSLFSSSLMYLDVAEEGEKMDANSLFLLGGIAFQTASQILSEVLEDLEKDEKRFKMNATFKSDRNIIDALNSGSRDNNYSNMVIDNIKLTSSFRF